MSVEDEMAGRQFEIIDFLAGIYPDIDDVDILCTTDALSMKHCFKYFVYRGRIQNISPLSFKAIEAGDTELPDRLDYLAELHDEVGRIVLRSPTAVDEKDIHAQMVDAHNSDQVVELQVAIFPYPEINEQGKILNDGRKIISVWPIKLRAVKNPGEEVAFYRSGSGWKITFRRNTEPYKHQIGLHYLHILISRANEQIPTGELSVIVNGIPNLGIDIRQIKDFLNNEENHNAEISSYMKSYDPKNERAAFDYKTQILKLRARILALDTNLDKEQIMIYEKDITLFQTGFYALLGLGDERGDLLTDIVKKSRAPVINAITRAIKQIKITQPVLGALLDERISIASECQYVDDVDHPITWLT